jgi:ligand-binding SRPBCC domain-containing protein
MTGDDADTRLELTTILDAPPERVWAAVRTPAVLEHVAAPLVTFEPVEPPAFPETWDEDEYLVAIRLFGVLPLGRQWVRVRYVTVRETPGEQFYQLRDDGSGSLASTWDHRITLRETADGVTAYTDEVRVEAGVLTSLVWLFAHAFYRYRQRRWRRLVARWATEASATDSTVIE